MTLRVAIGWISKNSPTEHRARPLSGSRLALSLRLAK